MHEIINQFDNYILLSAIIPLGWFVIRYIRHSPFQVNKEGINLLLTRLAMILIIVLVMLSLFFHDYPGKEWVKLVAYSALVYFFWVDVVQLLRVQKQYPYNRRWRRRSPK